MNGGFASACGSDVPGHRRSSRKGRLAAGGLLLWAAVLAGCSRGEAKPPVDAVQEAFRDDALTARQAQGHRLFLERCATCHGAQGEGDGQNASNLAPPPPDFRQLAKLPVEDRRKVIESGTIAIGRSSLCPPRGRSLTAEDVDALLAWLDAVASRPAPVEAPAGGARWRRRAAQP